MKAGVPVVNRNEMQYSAGSIDVESGPHVSPIGGPFRLMRFSFFFLCSCVFFGQEGLGTHRETKRCVHD